MSATRYNPDWIAKGHRTRCRETHVQEWGEYYKETYTLPEMHHHLQHMAPFMAKCEEHFGGKRVLEIGTGSGIIALYFSQLGYDVTGLDYDRRVLAGNLRQNRRHGGEARFVNGDMFHLPFRPNTFDACYHQGLMEHFDPPQIQDALRAQTEICRRVVFAVPTRLWDGGTRGDERMWPGAYWLELLNGFRVLDIFGMSFCGLPARALNVLSRRLTRNRPAAAHRALALRKAGQIGFVIEKC